MLRVNRGISLRTLAAKVDVSPATLSNIETGKATLSVDRLGRIADALESSAEVILAERREPLATTSIPDLIGFSRCSGWREYPPLTLDPVLAAALTEFLRAGYHGTSMRDIARAANLSVSGVYHHYASKQEILRSLLQLAASDLLGRSAGARDEGSDAVERFSLLVEHLALWHTYRRALGFVGATEMRSLKPLNRREIVAMRIAQQRMLDREVEAAARLGRFATPHPREAARAIVTMCVAIPSWYRVDGSLTPEQIANQYVEFARDVVQQRPRR